VVSVLRVLGEFERIGDLALRVVNLWPDHALMRSRAATYELLLDLGDAAIERYRDSMRAWATMSVELATEVTDTPSTAGLYEERLLGLLVALEEKAAADSLGIVRFNVALPESEQESRPQATTMLGYELLVREGPVAGDLRFVVSVLRVLGEFERIGDLALRVVNLWPDHALMRSRPATYDLLLDLADAAIERCRDSMRARATMSVELATEVVETPSTAGLYEERLLGLLIALEGTDAARVAVRTLVAGKSLERIADHAGIIAVRLLYLLTGDAGHLTREVR
jgi:phosphate transport system protein